MSVFLSNKSQKHCGVNCLQLRASVAIAFPANTLIARIISCNSPQQSINQANKDKSSATTDNVNIFKDEKRISLVTGNYGTSSFQMGTNKYTNYNIKPLSTISFTGAFKGI